MKKIIAIAATISAASLGIAPAAFAGGAAGAVGVHLKNGVATNVAAAGAIGDGTSLAGVRLKTTPSILTTTEYDKRGRKKTKTESVDCECTNQDTYAFALNTDGDVNIPTINGIASGVDIQRSTLSNRQVGDGEVDIDADIDIDLDVDAQFN